MTFDPAATRRRIFDAAVAEFAEHGSAGARVDRIAAKAKANKESIYRYYGTKDELLRRVLDQYLVEKSEHIDPKATTIDQYIADVFQSYIAEPEFVRLLMWEALERGSEESSEQRIRHFQEKVDSIVTQQRAGTIDPTLDPRHLLIALLGMANYWVMLPQFVRAVLGEEPDEQTVARHRRLLADYARRIIAPRDEAASPES